MKKIVFILVIGMSFLSLTNSKIEALIQKEIKAYFDIENYTKQSLKVSQEINETLPIQISSTNFFKIVSNNELKGYYYFGQAFGKADYFDFIVIFDESLVISKVKILVYREDHGGEIGSKRWLRQFSGKTKDKQLEYQKDIAAISGATISAKAMTTEINKLLKTINILHNNKQF
ncbi:FMN-binding protein [uncultured Lutibacter sp.]|uniref:FMN-binding protein n=1 Tax=uncultured Lutibacter sp. TaxID=437739 RepID=UPI00262494A0|nr:FMN-binding protein [uncultured Lutibacter sp.]